MDMAWNICQNCQVSFENMELLALHSCDEIKQEMSEFDETISDDPLYINKDKTGIKVEEGKDQLASIIEMVHTHNLKLQEGKKLYDENYLTPEETSEHKGKNQIIIRQSKKVHEEKNLCPKCNANFRTIRTLRVHIEVAHEKNIETVDVSKVKRQKVVDTKLAYKYFCDICEKPFSKSYLKVHMLNKHQIENFCLGKDPKDQNSNTKNGNEGKNQMIVQHSKTIHEEEILCPKCNANFETIRHLRIHIEEAHEKKIETVDVSKAKRLKVAGTKTLPVVSTPNPYELTNGEIFDYLLCTMKIRPRHTEYRKHVKDTVLSFNDISIDKLTDSSVKSLDKKAERLAYDLRHKWKVCGDRDKIYRKYQYSMDYSFDWVPELKEDLQKDEDKNKHLSDEFLTTIIKQVNDAYNNICDNDTDLDRTEISQNLKNLSNCYQKILSDRKANL